MQPSSPISSFKLNQDPQSPPVPSILRSRHKTTHEGDTRKVRQLILHPKQIIIDAHKYNQQYPSNKDKHPANKEGIRSQIDACLNAVSKVYEEQAKRKNGHILKQLNDYTNEPVFSKNSIHRVDAHLILKYIGTITQQYGLQNKLHKLDIISQIRSKARHTTTKNPQERFTSVERTRGHSKRSFINLTVSNKKQKRQESPSKKQINASHHALSTNNSPHRTLPLATPQQVSASKSKGKLQQDFKYCINCQQSILSYNIDYHQTHQCKEFQNIYKLSFSDLTLFITNKINKFKMQIEDKLNHLRTIQSQHQKQFPKVNLKDQICENVLKSIENYLRSQQNENLSSYKVFKQALRNDFFQCIGLTEKLNYFTRILSNLSQHTPQLSQQPSQVINSTKRIVQMEKGQGKSGEEYRMVVNGVSHFSPNSD